MALTPDQIATYHRDGFLVVRHLFAKPEMERLLTYARSESRLLANGSVRKDAAGRESRLAIWNDPGDDLFGQFSRSRRIIEPATTLVGEEVYHWHAKMMLKQPQVGGAWEWHQDFGYWYLNGVLAPDLISCMVAVDRAHRANGCLQILKGSHRLGRLDHGRVGEQAGIPQAQVDEALRRFEKVHFEADPGDAVFFHCNTLHASAANTSPDPRWSLIMCYNARTNSPYAASTHASYRPLQPVDDQAILAWREPQPIAS